MKPPEQVQRDLVRQWIQKADQDMAAAEILLKDGDRFRPVIAFHSQQAVEKYLKAVLVRHRSTSPRPMTLERCSIWLPRASPPQPQPYRKLRCSHLLASR